VIFLVRNFPERDYLKIGTSGNLKFGPGGQGQGAAGRGAGKRHLKLGEHSVFQIRIKDGCEAVIGCGTGRHRGTLIITSR
jgi:hypothetical protein